MANKKNSRNTKSRKKRIEEEKELEEQMKFTTNITNKIIIAVGVLCILGLFFLLTVYITNKHADDDNDSSEAEVSETNNSSSESEESTTGSSISYDEIILGRSLSLSDEDYIVVYYDSSNEDISSTYSSLISSYKEKDDNLPIYYVDMSNYLNKNYVTDGDVNYSPDSEADIKINGPTLIRVTNNKVEEYIMGEEDITNYLS